MSFELTSQARPEGPLSRTIQGGVRSAGARTHARARELVNARGAVSAQGRALEPDAAVDPDPQGEIWLEIFSDLQWLVGHAQSLCCREPLRSDLTLRGAILAAVRESAGTAIDARRRPWPPPLGALSRALRALEGLRRVLAIARGRGLLGDDDFLRFRRQASKIALGLRLLQAEQILGPAAPHPNDP